MKKILLPLLLSSLCGEVLAEKLTFKFTRSGSGGGGGTILWQGIVVDVEGNTVSPRYTVHHRVFFSRWDDFSASAVQACERDPDGFSTESNCITSKSESITIPEENRPSTTPTNVSLPEKMNQNQKSHSYSTGTLSWRSKNVRIRS